MLSFLLSSLIRYLEKSPISKKIKILYYFWGQNINNRNKILHDKGAKRLGANGKVGERTQGRTGKWAKRPGGETTRDERESGRNDSGANGKVGETTRIRSGTVFFFFESDQTRLSHRYSKKYVPLSDTVISRFRYLNCKLYIAHSSSSNSYTLFTDIN